MSDRVWGFFVGVDVTILVIILVALLKWLWSAKEHSNG